MGGDGLYLRHPGGVVRRVEDKFQFIVQSIDDLVGATIGRPAVQYCEFAETQCEYERFLRAGGGSPPLHPYNYYSAINANLIYHIKNAPLSRCVSFYVVSCFSGAFEKFIFRLGARDFGLDSVMKGEGILCVFQTFHKPEPGRKIRSPGENQFRECNQTYSWGPAATRALPSSLPVYLVKFFWKRAARSFAFSSQTEASA